MQKKKLMHHVLQLSTNWNIQPNTLKQIQSYTTNPNNNAFTYHYFSPYFDSKNWYLQFNNKGVVKLRVKRFGKFEVKLGDILIAMKPIEITVKKTQTFASLN